MRLTARGCAAAAALLAAWACAQPAAGSPPVTVHFQGESRPDWSVEPRAPSVRVMRGEVFESLVRVRNRSAHEVVAMVVKEIRPQDAAADLVHLGCGPTFTLVLKPGETVAVPSTYFVVDSASRPVVEFEVAYSVYSFEPHAVEPLRLGRRIYAERCVNCHGPSARGDGSIARLLVGGVSDLAPSLRRKTDRELLQAIAQGVGPMPAFSPALSVAEQQALVVYLRDLGK